MEGVPQVGSEVRARIDQTLDDWLAEGKDAALIRLSQESMTALCSAVDPVADGISTYRGIPVELFAEDVEGHAVEVSGPRE